MSDNERDFLDDVGDEPEQVTEEVTEQPEAEPETVETAPEAEPEVPTTPEPKEDRVPIAALLAERDKRQELQRRLTEHEQRQQAEQPKQDFFENPDEYMQGVVNSVNQAATQRIYMALEEQAREANPDYDEVFAEVKAHAEDNPAVVQKILNAPNPASAAYKLGKQLREFKAMQDPEAYREKLRAELRAELAAENTAKEEARRRTADAIPPDLTDSRNAKADDLPPPGTVFSEIFD